MSKVLTVFALLATGTLGVGTYMAMAAAPAEAPLILAGLL